MINKSTLTVAAFIAAILVMPRFAFAEGEAVALGQAVDLTGGSLPEEIRNFTGVGSGASSWDYLSQKISYGYFIEVYSHFDALAKSKVDRRNGIEDLVVASYGTDAKTHLAVADVKFNQDYAQHVMATEFAQRSGRGTQIANTYTLNTYLPHSDGSVEYFKDGLLARVDNQRSADEFGNVSIKNLYNFEYDLDRRLMLKHEYTTTDCRGLKTNGTFTCTYTADSVFYGSDETNANKHYASYSVSETDSTGRVRTTAWTAGVYEGKYLRDFTQMNFDSVEGISEFRRFNIQYSAPGQISSYDEKGVGLHVEGEDGTKVPFMYTLSRTNITYYNGQVAGYDEVRYDMPANMTEENFNADLSTWVKTTSHVTMEYMAVPSRFGEDVDPDAPRLKKTTIVSNTDKPDGSHQESTVVTEYEYDNTYTLTGGTIHSDISGHNPETLEYSFTDAEGAKHILSRTEKDGVVTFTYLDDEGNQIEVAQADVVTEIKIAEDYSGYTDTVLEIVSGTPMAKQTTSHTVFEGIPDEETGETQTIRIEDSTITFTNAVVGYFPRVLSTTESTTTSFPGTDADNEHQSTKNITTTFTYDANGFLTGASGEGYGDSWSYSSEQGWNSHIYSKFTVVYQVKLDRAQEMVTYEQFVPIPGRDDLDAMGITEEQFKAYMRGYFKLNPPEPNGDGTVFAMDNPFLNDKNEYELPADFEELVALGNGSNEPVAPVTDPFADYPDEPSIMAKTWDVYNDKDYANAIKFADEVIKRYAETAQEQQASLKDFAPEGSEAKYWALNDVAIAHYIKGKALLAQGKTAAAKKEFQTIIDTYGFGQCLAKEGWYWKLADGANEELKKLE
ncbi:MAG TPA: hypothetical protein PK107_05525 [Candidatus Omnitrophota bacterium]|nr:hypothetical protein [Candidatus Omnitrophota bacterium]HQO38259.1 hypothetical protein [Candidatus Omnitrophota bacterium]